MADMDFEPVRQHIRQVIRDLCYKQGLKDKASLYATEIEQGLFDAWAITDPIQWSPYYQRCALVLGHLDSSSYVGNRGLIERISKGSVAPKDIANMAPQELFPEHWTPILARIEAQRQHDRKCTGLTTNQFICRRCKKNECTYYQSQNRSADEPMNTFITCINCGNQWKE